MSDYLSNIIGRSFGLIEVIQPRRPSAFEIARSGSFPEMTEIYNADVASDGRKHSEVQPEEEGPEIEPILKVKGARSRISQELALLSRPLSPLDDSAYHSAVIQADRRTLDADGTAKSSGVTAGAESSIVRKSAGSQPGSTASFKAIEVSGDVGAHSESHLSIKRKGIGDKAIMRGSSMTGHAATHEDGSHEKEDMSRTIAENTMASNAMTNLEDEPINRGGISRLDESRFNEARMQGAIASSASIGSPKIPSSPEIDPSAAIQSDTPWSEPEPEIHVTIGRIDVRARSRPEPMPEPARPKTKIISLDDYLRSRRGGS